MMELLSLFERKGKGDGGYLLLTKNHREYEIGGGSIAEDDSSLSKEIEGSD
jgi:hypothetical protein